MGYADGVGRVRISLLGGWTMTGIQPDRLSLSGRRVLTYLSLRGRAGRRELAGTLWPDVSEQRAQGSLRTALWRLRNVDEGLVAGSVDDLWLGSHVDVDVHEVVPLVHAILSGDGCRRLSGLPDVLVSGELAPTLQDDWLVIERERLRQLQLHALESLALGFAAEGRIELGLKAGAAAVRAGPLRESARRVLVGIHLRLGNVAEARRQVEEFGRLLRVHLGIRPSHRLREMVGDPIGGH